MRPETLLIPVPNAAAEGRELQEALKMLYHLLEDYAPMWYTEEYRAKAEAALRQSNGQLHNLV
jgi:hypothetical protein